MAAQVDGYGPDEFDGIHWDLLVGTILAGLIGGALVYLSGRVSGSAPTILLIAGAGVIVLAIIGCAISNFFRRYAFLIWWRRGLAAAASTPILMLQAAVLGAFLFPRRRRFFAITIRGFPATVIDTGYRPEEAGLKAQTNWGGSGEEDVAVDEDGRVYQWNPWQGKWRYRADSLDGFPAKRLRIKRTIFGPVEAPPDETHASRVDF